MPKAPLAIMKERFGSKDALVEKVASLVAPLEGETKDDLKTRLRGASNKKLLKLLDTEEKVEELFGSKDKLVDGVLQQRRPRAKKVDQDFRGKLAKKSKAELLMLHAAGRKTSKRARAGKRKAS
jgi:hypothetical protein